MLPEIYPKKRIPKDSGTRNFGFGYHVIPITRSARWMRMGEVRESSEGQGRRPARGAGAAHGRRRMPAASACVTGTAAARAEQVDAGEDDGW